MVTTKQQIMDIAMNLNRIGNWAADGYEMKQKRILVFLHQTNGYVDDIKERTVSAAFIKTLNSFLSVFSDLYTEGINKPKDTDVWAEKMMTWGNILTHRAKFLTEDNIN